MERTDKNGRRFQIVAIIAGFFFFLGYLLVQTPEFYDQLPVLKTPHIKFDPPSPKYKPTNNTRVNNASRMPSTYSGFLCGPVKGNVGNRLFVFASIYGIAKMKNIPYIIPKNDALLSVFNLFNDTTLQILQDVRKCDATFYRKEKQCCGYDPSLLNLDLTKGYTLITYLQSWKYFENVQANLRKQLTFRTSIREWANRTLEKISREHNYTRRDDVTFVGVHVRRGDMMRSVASYGYQVATPEYLHKAIAKFQNISNIIYIVCSLEIRWVQEHLRNLTNVFYSDPKHGAHKDMALLAACDHVITTVGTFGWWGGWLSGGNVTYFKWPAKQGSGLRKQFSKDFKDFFLPDWIGL